MSPLQHMYSSTSVQVRINPECVPDNIDDGLVGEISWLVRWSLCWVKEVTQVAHTVASRAKAVWSRFMITSAEVVKAVDSDATQIAKAVKSVITQVATEVRSASTQVARDVTRPVTEAASTVAGTVNSCIDGLLCLAYALVTLVFFSIVRGVLDLVASGVLWNRLQ